MAEDKGGVEHLKDRLYSRKEGELPPDVRAPLSPSEAHAPLKWQGDMSPRAPRATFVPTPAERMALATKFFLGSLVFFILAGGGALLFFFSGGNYISSQNIDLEIIAPALVDGGTAANLQFIITNRNPTELELADLAITYPEGTRDPKNPQKALSHERLSIGTIAPGRQVKLTSSAVFYGSEGTAQTIRAELEYSVKGSNAVFTKAGDVTITLGSSPVSVSVDAPQEIIAGQPFALTVTVQSNSAAPVEDVLVQAQYPFGFRVDSASPRADGGSTLWRLGTMPPGSTQVIRVTGRIDGQDGDERVFRFLAGSNDDQTAGKISVPFLSVPITLTVHRPFITGELSVDGKTGGKVAIGGGRVVQGSVSWRNNLQDPVQSVELRLTFAGPALDQTSIKSNNGFYQSADNSIVWTSAQDPSLAQVPPGGSGTLQFSFATLPAGSGGIVYTNPIVDLTLSVRGVRAGQGSVPESVASSATMEVVVASAVSLSATALHFTGPLVATGPMPPQAETSTTYSIVWSVKNSSNAIANGTVSAILPTYVQFVSAAEGSGVTYDVASRTVRWDAGELKAGVGYTLPARQGAFLVSLTPSASQVGQAPALTGAAALSGTDRFAQVKVSATAEAPTTRLSEPGFVSGMDIVAPKQ